MHTVQRRTGTGTGTGTGVNIGKYSQKEKKLAVVTISGPYFAMLSKVLTSLTVIRRYFSGNRHQNKR